MEEDLAGYLDVKEDVHGLFFCAVDIIFEVRQELQKQFSLTAPPPLERVVADQLLRLVVCLESFSTTICTIRRLVDATFYVFLATDSVHTCSALPGRPSGTRAKRTCHILENLSKWDRLQKPLQSLGLRLFCARSYREAGS